jgi:hypothetical protein
MQNISFFFTERNTKHQRTKLCGYFDTGKIKDYLRIENIFFHRKPHKTSKRCGYFDDSSRNTTTTSKNFRTIRFGARSWTGRVSFAGNPLYHLLHNNHHGKGCG